MMVSCFFFFKQKTAYEMRISDWSSDVALPIWAIEQGVADRKRICIYGGSYGGYAALMGLIQQPDLYQCAIGYAGVYDLRMMTKRGDIDNTAAGRDYLATVLSTDPEWLRERSPALRAADIQHPVLIIHGGQDERVPPGQDRKSTRLKSSH